MENSGVVFHGFEFKTGVNFFVVLIALGVIRSDFNHSSVPVQKRDRYLSCEQLPNPYNIETADELFGFDNCDNAFNLNNQFTN